MLCILGSGNRCYQIARLRIGWTVTGLHRIHIRGNISDWNALRFRSIFFRTIIPEIKFNKKMLAHRRVGSDQSLQIHQRLVNHRRGI